MRISEIMCLMELILAAIVQWNDLKGFLWLCTCFLENTKEVFMKYKEIIYRKRKKIYGLRL